jgi:hypothetical protein
MLTAAVTMPPAYDTHTALVRANEILGERRIHECGGEENADSAEVIRKALINVEIAVRGLYLALGSGEDRRKLSRLPEVQPYDTSTKV